jgi:hypothetical protein
MVYNTKIEGDSYYVCYERPPPLAYDHTTETIDFNDVTTNGDPVPYTLMTELPLACGLYGTNMAMIGKSYTSTLGNYKYVSTSLDTLKGTYDTINNLRTSYCGRTGLTAIQQSACQALAEFGSAGADPNISTLTGIRDALNTGVTSMSNLYTTTIKPAYDGMNCKTPSIQMPF